MCRNSKGKQRVFAQPDNNGRDGSVINLISSPLWPDACNLEPGTVVIDIDYPSSPLLDDSALVFLTSNAHVGEAQVVADHTKLEANSMLANQGLSLLFQLSYITLNC